MQLRRWVAATESSRWMVQLGATFLYFREVLLCNSQRWVATFHYSPLVECFPTNRDSFLLLFFVLFVSSWLNSLLLYFIFFASFVFFIRVHSWLNIFVPFLNQCLSVQICVYYSFLIFVSFVYFVVHNYLSLTTNHTKYTKEYNCFFLCILRNLRIDFLACLNIFTDFTFTQKPVHFR